MGKQAVPPEFEAGVKHILNSPTNRGKVEAIVCRPGVGQRQELQEAQLCVERGLVGDNWLSRGNKKTADGSANPDMQLNIMNARVAALVAGTRERWPLAGDQFYVDMDLSGDNLPPGTRLKLGTAVIEVTAEPHLGCRKFSERFGREAVLFVNSTVGKTHNFRGINAKVVQAGVVHCFDEIEKLP